MKIKDWTKVLFYFSILIHLFFYISIIFTGTLNIFFDHVTPGQDFYCIPDAVYAFFHGGDLQGHMPLGLARYAECCSVNANVYHPLFTFLIGIPLQLLSPQSSLNAWIATHLVVTIATLAIIFIYFKHNKYLYLASGLLLLNSYQYYEIQQPQYHFLFGFFTFLLILNMTRKIQSIVLAGIVYYLSLLVKPIGALWVLPLFIAKKYKILIIGIGLFIVSTIPFHFFPFGQYYLNNLSDTTTQTVANYNIMALLHVFPNAYFFFRYTARAIAVLLIAYQIIYKPSIWKIITLWTCFQLVFYSVTFPYHYSVLAYLIPLGILLNEIKLTNLQKIILFFLTAPTPIVFFHIAGAPEIIPQEVYTFAAVWSSSFVLLFCAVIICEDIKLKQLSKIKSALSDYKKSQIL